MDWTFTDRYIMFSGAVWVALTLANRQTAPQLFHPWRARIVVLFLALTAFLWMPGILFVRFVIGPEITNTVIDYFGRLVASWGIYNNHSGFDL